MPWELDGCDDVGGFGGDLGLGGDGVPGDGDLHTPQGSTSWAFRKSVTMGMIVLVSALLPCQHPT